MPVPDAVFFRAKGSFSLLTYILTITSEYELEWEVSKQSILQLKPLWTGPNDNRKQKDMKKPRAYLK